MTDHTPTTQSVVAERAMEQIAFNLCSLHDFDPAFVSGQERFARAVITEYLRAAPAPSSLAGGEVREAVHAWLREDASLASKMNMTPDVVERLVCRLAALSPEAPARKGVDVLVQNAVAASVAEDQQWTELSAPARAVLMIQICRRVTAALTPRHEAPAALCDHGHTDPMALCSDCEAASVEAPAEGPGEVEMIARAIDADALLEDSDGCIANPTRREKAMAAARRVLALRSRSSAPEAREGGAVAWRWRFTADAYGVNGATPGEWKYQEAREQVSAVGQWRVEQQPLYTHPAAPSADKLRTGNLWWDADDWEVTFDNIEDAYEQATDGECLGVARLGRASEHDAVWAVSIYIDRTGDGEADDREIRLFATEAEALAALKAEV